MTIDKFEWNEDQIEIEPPTDDDLAELNEEETGAEEPQKSDFQRLIDAFMNLIGK